MPAKPKPAFPAHSHLFRYIYPDEKHGKRASPGAFMPNPGDDHLSVNALELESPEEIAKYYADVFGSEDGSVSVCIHTIFEYNDSGKKANCWIQFNRTNSTWEFLDSTGQQAAAYRHRPVLRSSSFLYSSWSHCGVEFVRVLADVKLRQFARRMVKRKVTIIQT